MTGWYNPVMLLQTGIRVLVSTIFGEFADRREILAAANAIAPQPFDPTFDYSGKATNGEFWFDYVADTGDGWNSTYAIADLVTRPALSIGGVELPRGRVQIFGGDEVYPTPSREAYEDRLLGPFEEALERAGGAGGQNMPDLYALPGNHDWYDGLTAFLALFCRRRIAPGNSAGIDRPGRKIAGRATFQTRSYFALKLPHDWWIWGTDSQIEGYLDQPQVDFFQYVASNWMERGSKLILCCGQPSWAYVDPRNPEASFTTFSYLERLAAIAEDKDGKSMGHELKLVLTGDSHHYSRYSEDGSVQYITAGGGGAFLHPTHHLADRHFRWDYPPPNGPAQKKGAYDRSFRLQQKADGKEAVFPERSASRRLTAKNAFFPFLNPGMLLFYWIGYVLYFWSLEASSVIGVDEPLGRYVAAQPDFVSALLAQLVVGLTTPWPALLAAVSILMYVYFADEPYSRVRRICIGTAHGLVQAAAVTAISCASFRLAARELGTSVGASEVVPIVGGSLLAAFVSATIFGCYLWLCLNVLGIHWNEGFSSLRSRDFKNFLRVRVGADGALRIYPVGLRKVPAALELEGSSLMPELIEAPVVIR